MEETGWDNEIFKKLGEDLVLNDVKVEGQGETCVICGKVKDYFTPFYCDECVKWGNYQG